MTTYDLSTGVGVHGPVFKNLRGLIKEGGSGGGGGVSAGDTAIIAAIDSMETEIIDLQALVAPITKEITLSVDTLVYAAGDLIADAQLIEDFTPVIDQSRTLISLEVVDEDDQKAALTVYLSCVATSWGTENSAPAPSDATIAGVIDFFDIAVADYRDIGNGSVAARRNLSVVCRPMNATTDLVAIVVNGGGAPLYTASGLKLRLGFV